jgi:hypothetical protein
MKQDKQNHSVIGRDKTFFIWFKYFVLVNRPKIIDYWNGLSPDLSVNVIVMLVAHMLYLDLEIYTHPYLMALPISSPVLLRFFLWSIFLRCVSTVCLLIFKIGDIPIAWLTIHPYKRKNWLALLFQVCYICVMKTKYTYNLVRPVSYIRSVFGDTAWLSFIPTPAHPEYSSAHSVISAAASEALTAIYGNIGPLTDHTWDYLGFPARTFNTFRDIGMDAGNSRFYGGIHYQPSIDAGLKQGRIVGGNIINRLLKNVGIKE